METSSAVQLVKALKYKPGWTIDAESAESRFEGTIWVRFTFDTYRSERHLAALGYPEVVKDLRTRFRVIVADVDDDAELYGRVLDAIVRLETHEAREFLRVAPTNWAPYHPHRVDGMKRWAKRTGEPIEADLTFDA